MFLYTIFILLIIIVVIFIINTFLYIKNIFFIFYYYLNTFRLFHIIFDKIIDIKIKKYKKELFIDSNRTKNMIISSENCNVKYIEKLSQYFHIKMKIIDNIILYSSYLSDKVVFSINNINNRFFACAFENIWNPKFHSSNIIVIKIENNHSYQDIDNLVNKIKILVYKIKKLNLSNFYSNYILNKIDYIEN